MFKEQVSNVTNQIIMYFNIFSSDSLDWDSQRMKKKQTQTESLVLVVRALGWINNNILKAQLDYNTELNREMVLVCGPGQEALLLHMDKHGGRAYGIQWDQRGRFS